jgi:hypothetical protein
MLKQHGQACDQSWMHANGPFLPPVRYAPGFEQHGQTCDQSRMPSGSRGVPSLICFTSCPLISMSALQIAQDSGLSSCPWSETVIEELISTGKPWILGVRFYHGKRASGIRC